MPAFGAFVTSDDARGNGNLRKKTETERDSPSRGPCRVGAGQRKVAPNGSVCDDTLRPPSAMIPDTVRGRRMVMHDRCYEAGGVEPYNLETVLSWPYCGGRPLFQRMTETDGWPCLVSRHSSAFPFPSSAMILIPLTGSNKCRSRETVRQGAGKDHSDHLTSPFHSAVYKASLRFIALMSLP